MIAIKIARNCVIGNVNRFTIATDLNKSTLFNIPDFIKIYKKIKKIENSSIIVITKIIGKISKKSLKLVSKYPGTTGFELPKGIVINNIIRIKEI